MPDDIGRPDLAGKLNLLPQYNALGTTRPLGPGEYVTNSDGSWSNEYSSTVQLGDKWSVVPTLWLRNGKPAILSEDEAAATASKSGLNFPSFPSEQAAESFSQDREAQWQKTPVGRSDMQPPLWTKQQMPDDTDLPAWARPKQSGPAAPRAADLPAWARPQMAQDQPRGDPLSSLWESLKGYGAESAAALGDAARQLPGEVAGFGRDVATSLLPGRGGAEAGGRVLEKIGDVGTFLSGGLQNPLGMPVRPQFGERARGLGTEPRVAPVPRPQLALPPPTVGAAGRPAISTGEGIIPPGPAATMTAPSATPARPGTGVTPVEPLPRPGAGPDPLVQPGAERGPASQLASAFASNDGSMVDRATARRFRQFTNTRAPGRLGGPGLMMQDQRITTAVDSIIDAKNSIRFKDQAGNELPAGRLPRNVDEFVQGIDHLKGQVFEQYDTLAKQQGARGVQVPLQPAVNRLLELAAQPEVASLHPELIKYAQELAERWAADGSYSPKQMQNLVQHMNEQLAGLQRAPTAETYSRSTMLSQVLNTLRGTLNQTMETALQGPQYQALRNRYASLAEIEGDVANALRKQLASNPALGQSRGLIERAADWAILGGVAHGAAFLDPKTAGGAAALAATRELIRYRRSPNRAVTKLFAKRAQELDPTVSQRLSAEMATNIADIRQRAYDANVSGNIAEVQRLGNQRRNLTPPGGF